MQLSIRALVLHPESLKFFLFKGHSGRLDKYPRIQSVHINNIKLDGLWAEIYAI